MFFARLPTFLLFLLSFFHLAKANSSQNFQSFKPLRSLSESPLCQSIQDANGEEVFGNFREVFNQEILPLSFVGSWKMKTGSSNSGKSLSEQTGRILMNFNGGWGKSGELRWYRAPATKPNFQVIQILVIEGDYLDDTYHEILFDDLGNSSFDSSTMAFHCSGSQSLIDINFNKILDRTQEEQYHFNSNGSFSVILTLNSEREEFILEAKLQIDSVSFRSTLSYNIFFRAVMIAISLTNIRLIIKRFPSKFEDNKISPATRGILGAYDLIFFTSMYIPPQSEFLGTVEVYLLAGTSLYFLLGPSFRMILFPSTIPKKEQSIIIVWNVAGPMWIYLLFIILHLNTGFSFGLNFLISLYILPQIIENARKGSPVSFEVAYLLELISLRPLLFVYFKGVPDNIFHVSTSIPQTLVILCCIGLQVLILYQQFMKGPRFFLPDFLIQRCLRNSEAPLLNGQEQEMNEMRSVCYLCMEELTEDPSAETRDNLDAQAIIDRMRRRPGDPMETECEHTFHTICLVEWMMVEMVCPTCGARLNFQIER